MTNMSFNYVFRQNPLPNSMPVTASNSQLFSSIAANDYNAMAMISATSAMSSTGQGFSSAMNTLMGNTFGQAEDLTMFAGLMQGMMQLMSTFMQKMNPTSLLQQNNLFNNTPNGLYNNGILGNNTQLPFGNNINNFQTTNPINGNMNTSTIPLSGAVTDRVAQLANHESTLGINEADGSYKKYGQPSHWCGAFADWCFKQATGDNTPWKGENFHYVPNITNWAKKKGVYKAYDPSTLMQDAKAGDMIIFRGSSRGENSHVGIVTKVYPDGSIDTVEGNTSDQCKKKHYKAGDSKIQGFLQAHILEQQGLLTYI